MPTLISMIELTLIRGSAAYDDVAQPYQKMWRLVYADKLDPATDDFDAIAAETGLPDVGDPVKPGDPRLCKKKNVAGLSQTGSEFLVTADYEIPKNEFTYNANPLDRPDELGGGGQAQTESYYKDASTPTAKYAKTGAGELILPLPVRGTSGLSITIGGNRSSLPLGTWASYLRPHSRNNGAFTVRGISVGTGEAKLTNIGFSREIENTYSFWRISWNLDVAPDWDQKVYHRGFYCMDSGQVKEIFVGETKERITQPWPLDSDGTKKTNFTDDPYEDTLKPCPPKDFSIFGWTTAP